MAGTHRASGSHLESVVDNAFYFSAGSTMPGEEVEPLEQWEVLRGESKAEAAARRAAVHVHQQVIQDVAHVALHAVHDAAFHEVTQRLQQGGQHREVPAVLLHAGE